MKWKHKCSLEWLKARQQCLTASDVKSLIPVTRTGRKRTIDDEDYIRVLSKKMINLTEDDRVSIGAAARGHVLEPYAIEMFNDSDIGIDYGTFHHWDDVVFVRDGHKMFELGFSPDAMNIDMSQFMPGVMMIPTSNMTAIAEVKCYQADHHMACAYTPKDLIEERWQLATAMAVCESIENAYLLFYNPSMKNQLYIADYDRQDLEKEIDMVLDVEENWLAWLANFRKLNCCHVLSGDEGREQEIINQIIKSEELNPEGERSVTL